MLERSVRITNALGLHARAAAQLVRKANRFKCRVLVTRYDSGVSANAKSLLSVLHLAAAFGVEIKITTNGEDELDAIDAIEKLFVDGFGEN
ncbi:HPr family phosphocarrier protein [soil metagenome]